MASDLKEMPLTSKAREALGIISDCADHLLSLVNDVLDFARYQSTSLDSARLSSKSLSIGSSRVSLSLNRFRFV